MTTALDLVLARRLRDGASPEDLAGRWGLTPEAVRIRAEAAGWVPEQPDLPMRAAGLVRR